MSLNITLKDGSVRAIEPGMTVYEFAKSISGRLAKEAMAGEMNGKVVDLRTPILTDCSLNILKFEDQAGKDAFRHTSAHILAQAIKRIYPQAKLAIGPAIERGFYYDIDMDEVIGEEDLAKIEKEMAKIVSEKLDIERFELPRAEAIKFCADKNEDYKVELIEDLPDETVLSFYRQGEFTDLCAGPHLFNTKDVKGIKLLSVAGAYWRGDSDKKMLQRIYGVSFPKKSLLEEHLAILEEAKKRDHRKLGKELGLFAIMQEGPGFPFLLPKGTIIRNKMVEYWRELHTKANYLEVETPIILNRQLWETSGHWYHYKENMYSLKIDDEDYAIKPMNCPGGMLIYNNDVHSYRDFPLRMGELGRVHRHELSGALHGLMRVRAFTQDDAHIFMLPEQIKNEIKGVVTLVDEMYSTFGFKYTVELSTRPDDFLGTLEEWSYAEGELQAALDELGIEYKINPGDGAFYGPKIDFHLEDCIGRTWQCGTIQLDLQLPQRFDLNYVGIDGEKHKPIVIHRVIYGSLERFMGILIEHYAGKFPTWLAPVQVKLLPISDKYQDYADAVYKRLKDAGIRVEMDVRAEKIGYKIRSAQLEKIPYMLIVGERERDEQKVAVRSRSEGDIGAVSLQEFVARINAEVAQKALNVD